MPEHERRRRTNDRLSAEHHLGRARARWDSKQSDRNRVQRLYGLTWEQYQELKKQPCAICGQRLPAKDMHIDHTTDGSYHGVLCRFCNPGIGFLRHDPARLDAAIVYVMATRGSTYERLPTLTERAAAKGDELDELRAALAQIANDEGDDEVLEPEVWFYPDDAVWVAPSDVLHEAGNRIIKRAFYELIARGYIPSKPDPKHRNHRLIPANTLEMLPDYVMKST